VKNDSNNNNNNKRTYFWKQNHEDSRGPSLIYDGNEVAANVIKRLRYSFTLYDTLVATLAMLLRLTNCRFIIIIIIIRSTNTLRHFENTPCSKISKIPTLLEYGCH